MSKRKYINIGKCKVDRETDKALLVSKTGIKEWTPKKPVWIPKSQVVEKHGSTYLSHWCAKTNKWVDDLGRFQTYSMESSEFGLGDDDLSSDMDKSEGKIDRNEDNQRGSGSTTTTTTEGDDMGKLTIKDLEAICKKYNLPIPEKASNKRLNLLNTITQAIADGSIPADALAGGSGEGKSGGKSDSKSGTKKQKKQEGKDAGTESDAADAEDKKEDKPEPEKKTEKKRDSITFTQTYKLKDGEFYHERLEECLRIVRKGIPLLLVGPSGCGKTHMVEQIADILGRPFTYNSMSEGVTESHLIGSVMPDSTGGFGYQESPLVFSAKGGGVHLFDEIDNSDANLLVLMNTLLSNRKLSLPIRGVEPILCHKDFAPVAAANTFGLGPDSQYVGRNRLDASTLDRFATTKIYMDYDRNLERHLATKILGEGKETDEVLNWCWKIRDGIFANRLERVMSTRTIITSATLLEDGDSFKNIKDRFLSDWSEADREQVAV